MANSSGKTITVGITGASGAIYARTVLRLLDADPAVDRVFLVSTETGMRLLATELGIIPSEPKKLGSLLTRTPATKIDFLPNKDVGAIIASGSTTVDGMVVVPCSAGTMGAIAAGTDCRSPRVFIPAFPNIFRRGCRSPNPGSGPACAGSMARAAR